MGSLAVSKPAELARIAWNAIKGFKYDLTQTYLVPKVTKFVNVLGKLTADIRTPSVDVAPLLDEFHWPNLLRHPELTPEKFNADL